MYIFMLIKIITTKT